MGETPQSGVYVVNADGTGLTQITGPGSSWAADNPEWSPDGSRIAFSGNYDGAASGTDVYVMNPDGSDLRNLTGTTDEQRSEYVIGWLPNGDLLIWQGPDGIEMGPGTPEQTERWLEITDTGQTVRVVYEGVANSPERRQGPSLSPDGRFVVFDTDDGAGNTVRFVDLGTGRVTAVATNANTPAWQPVLITSASGVVGDLQYVGGPTGGPYGPEPGRLVAYSLDGDEAGSVDFEEGERFRLALAPGTYRLDFTSGDAVCPEKTVTISAGVIEDATVRCSVK